MGKTWNVRVIESSTESTPPLRSGIVPEIGHVDDGSEGSSEDRQPNASHDAPLE
jgi:hypothetical protein